jgi:hypothetical protein
VYYEDVFADNTEDSARKCPLKEDKGILPLPRCNGGPHSSLNTKEYSRCRIVTYKPSLINISLRRKMNMQNLLQKRIYNQRTK